MDEERGSKGWWPEAAAGELLRDVEAVVPVVGAGFSSAAGLPGSEDLARRLASLIDDPAGGKGASLFAVADTVYGDGRFQRSELNEKVAAWMGKDENPEARPTPMHEELVRVPSRLIATFNYDSLFEDAAEAQGIAVESLTYRDGDALVDHLRSRNRSQLYVYHAHGWVGDPESLVLDHQSYRRVANDLSALEGLELLARMNSLCFLGTRLDEPYLEAMLLRQTSDHPNHVLICDEETAEEIAGEDARSALTPSRYGIVISDFPTGKWSCLEDFCSGLASRQMSPASIPLAPQQSAPYAHYVEPPITIRARDAHSEVMAYLRLSLGEEDGIALPDVSRAGRSVVVGPAGCGKSSLLHRLGSLQPELELSVRINLGSVTRLRGSPAELLRHWLQTGTGFQEQEISPDSRVILLLDGLDEVDLHDQEEAAEGIAGLADAFPQHRFVVASRLVPAVRTLAAAGFVEFEIHPTRLFAERFLAAQGSGVSELKERLPEVGHLGALGSNPFVLSKLVRLVDEVPDDLSKPQRFRWLLNELIAAFTRREAERLAYSTSALREAVGALAAAMSLHGLRTLDISTYPFETEEPIIAAAGIEEFLQEAARRLLVWAERAEFAFTEPVIEMFLAAEHILRLDPKAETLPRAIAPTIDSQHEFPTPDGKQEKFAIFRDGAREDLRGLAAFLAGSSPTWADALFSRDPALVARAVPADWPSPAPEERAEALWKNLMGLDKRKTHRLHQADATQWMPGPRAALAAILHHHRIPALQARMRKMAQNESAPPRRRGAALEALALSGRLSGKTLDGLADDSGIPEASLAVAIQALDRGLLLEKLIRRGENLPVSVADRFTQELNGMLSIQGAIGQIIQTLPHLDSEAHVRYFWQLVGIVRMNGSPDDLRQLWEVLITHHRPALERFKDALPRAIGHMGLLLAKDQVSKMPQDLLREMIEILETFDEDSEDAVQLRGELLDDPRQEAATKVSRKGAVKKARPKKSTGTKGAAPAKEKVPDEKEGIPVLMIRNELGGLIRSVTYGLSGERAINLASHIPEKFIRKREEDGEESKPPDPLMSFEAELDQLPRDPDWESVDRLLSPFRRLPFALRAAIGARLEQRLPAFAPDAGTPGREELLRRYGGLFALRPSSSEWAATALTTPFDRADWLKAAAPPMEGLETIVSSSKPEEIPLLLNAIPAEMRPRMVDVAAAVLGAAEPRSEEAEMAVAQALADGAANPDAILRLTEALPNPPPLFAGWAAAAGDSSSISPAFEHVFAEIEAGRAIELIDRNRLGWAESTLGRLSVDSLDPGALLRAFMRSFNVSIENPEAQALIAVLGVAACAVDPFRIVAMMELFPQIVGWTKLHGPFSSLAYDGLLSLHRLVGSSAAAEVLGVSGEDLKGERVLLRSKATG